MGYVVVSPKPGLASRLLGLAFLATLAACGGGGATNGTSTTPSGGGNPTPPTPTPPAPTPPAPTLTFIHVTPGNPTLSLRATQQFQAKGTHSDASSQDLTAKVVWSSTVPTVATITGAGLATGMGAGATSIQASLPGSLLTGSTVLTISGPVVPVLQTITITPPNPTVVDGNRIQFQAVGDYSDGTTQDLTTQVTWSSVPAGFISVSSGQQPQPGPEDGRHGVGLGKQRFRSPRQRHRGRGLALCGAEADASESVLAAVAK